MELALESSALHIYVTESSIYGTCHNQNALISFKVKELNKCALHVTRVQRQKTLKIVKKLALTNPTPMFLCLLILCSVLFFFTLISVLIFFYIHKIITMKLVKQAVQFFCRNAILAEIDRLVSYNVKLLKGLIFSLKAGK